MRRFNSKILNYMFAFEALTGAELIDCFELSDRVVFVVKQGQLGMALGKNKSNIAKVLKVVNQKIKIVEHKSDAVEFVKSLLSPLKPKTARLQGNTVQVIVNNPRIKGLILGYHKKNLKAYQEALNRHFKGLNIEVI